mmetsp:Transcript_80259/g.208609  ORF Transcript_80259/g.208609 Transcript_80259/m.208609 type:complete len:230 (-) Transcript_80259:834-1523(-)
MSRPPSRKNSDLVNSPHLLMGLTRFASACNATAASVSSSHLWKRNITAGFSRLRKTTSLFGWGRFELASTGNCSKSNNLQQQEESQSFQYSTTEIRERTACTSGGALTFSCSSITVHSKFDMTRISAPWAAAARISSQFSFTLKQSSISSMSKLWLLAATCVLVMVSFPGTLSWASMQRTFGVCALIDFLTDAANCLEALVRSWAINKSNILLYRLAFFVFFTLSTTYL